VSAKILDYGGIIAELNAPDRRGRVKNVVMGLSDLHAYEATGGLNSLIGRYANRIKGGFTIEGHHYDLQANPNGVTLHSGRPFYGAMVWNAQTVIEADRAGVTLSRVSPDGEQGFPGELRIHVTYTLNEANDLRLDYEATTGAPTVVTLTNHVYFNLAGNGSGDVYGQQLQVMADQYTPTDADQVPTGELAPVASTALDFRQLTPIGAHIRSGEQQILYAKGYDHNFVLRKPPGDAVPLAVRMYDPASGRLLELRTTEPGVQVYTANHMKVRAIVALTESGTTPLWMSRARSDIPIYAFTRHEITRRRVTLYRGVFPVPFDIPEVRTNELFKAILTMMLQLDLVEKGELVIVTKGELTGITGGTNAMTILRVPKD